MPRSTSKRPLTVSQLTQRITLALEDFGPLAVEGELSQVKLAASGHLYATLKDSAATVGLVMWRSALARNGHIPEEGERVVVRGSLSVYAPRGNYQLSARSIKPVGAGDLAARFEALKAKLLAEGLFDEERKRPLPSLPKGVGLATAEGSAALADLIDSIRGRFPSMPLLHAPCLVQGSGAAASIVRAIRRLEAHPDVSVIIVGRGGGSLEDLWAFNDEAVVRAIADCSKPVISAVGHETDVTLADLAADLRAKTPTMAGEIVCPVLADLSDRLDNLTRLLDEEVDRRLHQAHQRLQSLLHHRALAEPKHQIRLRMQRLDELDERIGRRINYLLASHRERHASLTRELRLCAPRRRLADALTALAQNEKRLHRASWRTVQNTELQLLRRAERLDALSPLKVLGRGYSVMQTSDERVIRSTVDVGFGQEFDARVTDGWIEARVTGTRGLTADERSQSGQ